MKNCLLYNEVLEWNRLALDQEIKERGPLDELMRPLAGGSLEAEAIGTLFEVPLIRASGDGVRGATPPIVPAEERPCAATLHLRPSRRSH
jgi:hypothetical protein